LISGIKLLKAHNDISMVLGNKFTRDFCGIKVHNDLLIRYY